MMDVRPDIADPSRGLIRHQLLRDAAETTGRVVDMNWSLRRSSLRSNLFKERRPAHLPARGDCLGFRLLLDEVEESFVAAPLKRVVIGGLLVAGPFQVVDRL